MNCEFLSDFMYYAPLRAMTHWYWREGHAFESVPMPEMRIVIIPGYEL